MSGVGFEREDWMLFRNVNTLGQKAGVPADRLAALIVKELVDNALDAGASVTLEGGEDGRYTVTDDGPGIPGTDEEVARLFSIRRPLQSSKVLRLPTRGALGNGLRVVAGGVLSTGGQLVVETRGRRLHLVPQDDGTTVAHHAGAAPEKGTRVELTLGGILARQNGRWMADLAIKMRGESCYQGRSSPWWYDSDGFYELCQASGYTLRDLGALFGVKLAASSATVGALTSTLGRSDAEALLEKLRGALKPPQAAKLGVVGDGAMACHGYTMKRGEMEIAPGLGKLPAKIPVVVEVWAIKLEQGKQASARIFVNRTPICAKVSAGQYGGREGKMWITGCGLDHYFKTGKAPMHVTICVTTPHMPIQTDGKEPNLYPIFSTVSDAIESACRKAKEVTSSGRAVSKRELILDCLEDAIDHASTGGKFRFSIRNLFYATRPLLLKQGIEEPDYDYFGKVIAAYEAENGDIPGMYRDARGVLIHPHTRERIELGTLNVETYKRPDWLFKRIVYIEKQGFFPVLEDAKWGERWDCALLSSQGQATRAVKDLLDLMGDTDEEITIFCVHDADGYGTVIHQSLVEGTLARPGRRVKVINLGLDPWEAKEMGLLSEKVTSQKEVPVARYVKEYDRRHWTSWADFLQTGRYELNAMTTERMIEWLDGKMEEHGAERKLVPPEGVLTEKFTATAKSRVREVLAERAIKAARVDESTERMMRLLDVPYGPDLVDEVKSRLEKDPTVPWGTPLTALAHEAAADVLPEEEE